jgi:cyanophycinase
MPSIVPEGATRGWIIPIGGAENKENDRHILERFVRCSGGRDADIVVIPTASRLHETGPRYEKLFREIGAARVDAMDFDTRRDCQEPGRLRRLEEASGIFFTGGNQLRLTTLLGGTPVAKLVRNRNASGVTVGGTSAGASILSEHMIAFGDEGSSVISGSVRLAPGLGLPTASSSTSTSGSATASGACSPRSPTTRSRSASASTRTPPRSSGRTRRWKWRAAAVSPSSMRRT